MLCAKENKENEATEMKVKVAGDGKDRLARRHSTAVVDFKVNDHPAFVTRGSMPTSCLWLKDKKKDMRKKGFLSEILRAYRVEECDKTDDCGLCRLISIRRKRKRSS